MRPHFVVKMFRNLLKSVHLKNLPANLRFHNAIQFVRNSSGNQACGKSVKQESEIGIEPNSNSSLTHSWPNVLAPLELLSQAPPPDDHLKSKELEVFKYEDLNLEYTRISGNQTSKDSLQRRVRNLNERQKNNEIVIQGGRTICSALMAGLEIKDVIFKRKTDLEHLVQSIRLKQLLNAKNVKYYQVEELKAWSKITEPEPIMALFKRPDAAFVDEIQKRNTGSLPITVICDNVREPSNLGNILRTCAAVPCEQVLLTPGCCDPWERKAFDSSLGGQLRVPVREDVSWSDVQAEITTYSAESCNVFVADNNQKRFRLHPSTVIEYCSLTDIGGHNILVIGGESQGVSDEAYSLMKSAGKRGKCVYIPIAAKTDSLNTATALALILFEMKALLNKVAADSKAVNAIGAEA